MTRKRGKQAAKSAMQRYHSAIVMLACAVLGGCTYSPVSPSGPAGQLGTLLGMPSVTLTASSLSGPITDSKTILGNFAETLTAVGYESQWAPGLKAVAIHGGVQVQRCNQKGLMPALPITVTSCPGGGCPAQAMLQVSLALITLKPMVESQCDGTYLAFGKFFAIAEGTNGVLSNSSPLLTVVLTNIMWGERQDWFRTASWRRYVAGCSEVGTVLARQYMKSPPLAISAPWCYTS